MIVFEITIAIFFAAILGTALSRKFHLPLELTLLVGSLGVALIPGIPPIHIDSEIIFFVLLPPILFAAAYFTSWTEFKRNIRPISFLALGLVVFTVCGMALVIKWLVPALTWPMAFLFGAIISPPDASAAATVTRKVGLPRRLQTVLEGESLINDATALVCYRFALAALLSGEFHLASSIGQFLLVGLGGVVVGLAIAHLMLRFLLHIQRRQRRSTTNFGHGFCLLFHCRIASSLRRDRHCCRRPVRRPDVAALGERRDPCRGESPVECHAARRECLGLYDDRAATADDSRRTWGPSAQ